MRYTENPIHTHREAPANARSQGQSWLIRAGYLSHSGQTLLLGERALTRIQAAASTPTFFSQMGLVTLSSAQETYHPTPVGSNELLYCPACQTASRAETAQTKKTASATEPPVRLEKVLTPECPTIESLAEFLEIPQAKTAKALMFVRADNQQFIFVVVRGDMTMSEAKLEKLVGKFRLASEEEICAVGAVPGYASPLGIKNARVIVDELIPRSANLVAGANQAGYHLLNTNYGRDYTADLVADLTLAEAGEPCPVCDTPLQATKGWVLATNGHFEHEKILFALAETHHDEKGLSIPAPAAPFDIYLMHVPGKTMDTLPAAEDLYKKLQAAGLAVLFDDRNDRAGVKFNDADLIGCPIRITVGERGLNDGLVEIKERKSSKQASVPLFEVIGQCSAFFQSKEER